MRHADGTVMVGCSVLNGKWPIQEKGFSVLRSNGEERDAIMGMFPSVSPRMLEIDQEGKGRFFL